MITYKNVKQEYVPKIDLTTLNKSMDTLEKGHKETVKAASDLETVLANLDLNEQEEGFRQEKLNQIQQAIDVHTIYGNAAAGYDDIVALQGNIFKDPGMIGRLNAQKAYKEFNTYLDKSNIPEGMKDMYRELNPYHYEDKVDENGNVIGQMKWEPNTRPVNSIDMNALMNTALKYAKTTSGTYNSVQYLDKNGNPTGDYRESADGLIYKQTNGGWTKLSEDAISAAVEQAIKNTPGAEDSLKQDYNYEMWKFNKATEIGENPISDVTDAYGVTLPYNKWRNQKITNFAEQNAYYDSKPQTTYGTALAKRREAELNYLMTGNPGMYNFGDVHTPYAAVIDMPGTVNSGLQNLILPSNSSNNKDKNNEVSNINASILGTISIETNEYANVLSNKSAIGKTGMNILFNALSYRDPNTKEIRTQYSGIDSFNDAIKKLGNGTVNHSDIINNIETNLGIKFDRNQKAQLSRTIHDYISYIGYEKQLLQNLDKDKKDAINFIADANNYIFKPDNKYGKKLISSLNRTFNTENGKEKGLQFEIGDKVMSQLISLYGTDINGLKQKLGTSITKNEDDNYIINFNSDNKLLYPEFITNLVNANNNVSGTFKGFLNRIVGKVHETQYKMERTIDGSIMRQPSSTITPNVYNKQFYIDNFVNTYNAGIKAASKVENAGIRKGEISVVGTNCVSKYDFYTKDDYMTDATEYSRQRENNRNNILNTIAGANINLGNLYILDNGQRFSKNIVDKADYAIMLKAMINLHKDKITSQYIQFNGDSDSNGNKLTDGYVLSFTVPGTATEEALADYKGKNITMLINGSLEEGISNIYSPTTNPLTVAKHGINCAKSTTSTFNSPIPYNADFGDTNIKYNDDGTFTARFMGTSIQMNENDAIDQAYYLNILENMSTIYANDIIEKNNNNIQFAEYEILQMNNNIYAVAEKLSELTNIKKDIINMQIRKYINSKINK